jgi:RiboL-PSP-HEPN
MEKFETLGEVARRIRKLLEDACVAEDYLNSNNSQFARRTYIRSTFAYMEGTIWVLKQLIIQTVSQSKAVTNPLQLLSLAELALLSDISYNLKENGEPYEQPKFLPMQKNLRLTVSVFNRFTRSSIDLQTNSTTWNRFNQIIQVRNRITHPKNVGDIDITDEEIQHAIEVCNWFNGISENCIEAFHKSFQKNS